MTKKENRKGKRNKTEKQKQIIFFILLVFAAVQLTFALKTVFLDTKVYTHSIILTIPALCSRFRAQNVTFAPNPSHGNREIKMVENTQKSMTSSNHADQTFFRKIPFIWHWSSCHV